MKTRILVLAAGAGILWAQEAHTFVFTKTAERTPMGIEQMMGGSIKGAPYSADVVTETVQMLADGNRIVNRQTGFVARDSMGRTRNDTAVQVFGAVNNDREAMKISMIHDPLAQITYTLDSNAKTVRKVSVNPPAEAAAKRAAEKEHLAKAVAEAKTRVDFKTAGTGKKESLGTQVIEGVVAEGTRTTETIPAGEIGNDKDILVVNEVWVAQDLKAVVLSKRTDPRMGEMTYKLTNIQRSEPAASVFEIPSDYQIVEGPSKNVMYLRTKE